MISGIYLIRCTENGRIYVGSAKNIKARWAWHQKDLTANVHYNRKLQHAYNKYGHNAFEWTVLEYVCIEKLIEREQYYIDSMGAADKDRGFNLAPKAGSCLGFKHSDKTKELWSKQRKGRPINLKHTDEWRAATAERMRGRTASPETRAKMSEAIKRSMTPERLAAMAERMRGKKPSPEATEKRVAKLRGKKRPRDVVERAAAAHRGMKHTERTKARLSEVAKRENLSDETRAKMSEAALGRVVTDETKEKLRKVMTGRQFTDEWRANIAAAAREKYRRKRAEAARLKAEQRAEATFLRTGIKPVIPENPKSETQGKLFD